MTYRFIDELPDLHYGSYIRWITIKDPENIKLTNGGIVCEMKVGDDGIIIVCKNKKKESAIERITRILYGGSNK